MMRKLCFGFFLVSVFASTTGAYSQQLNTHVVDARGVEKLLGQIDLDGLQSAPFDNWFKEGFSKYQPDMKTLALLENDLANYSIKIFMGTWCGDSKRELPKFYKILEAINFPKARLLTVAVDYAKPNYKKSPGGEEKGLNIVKVPTFIFYNQGKEVNRIIEFPVVSFEKDIQAILSGNGYVPNYNNMPVLPVD